MVDFQIKLSSVPVFVSTIVYRNVEHTVHVRTIFLVLICVPVGSEGGCCHTSVRCLSAFLLLMRAVKKTTKTAHLHP